MEIWRTKTSMKIGKGIGRLYVPIDAKIREWFGIQGPLSLSWLRSLFCKDSCTYTHIIYINSLIR
jgi:hypothetical protein